MYNIFISYCFFLQACVYTAKRSNSKIRVVVQLGIEHNTGCARWEVKLNGQQCNANAPLRRTRINPTEVYAKDDLSLEGLCDRPSDDEVKVTVEGTGCSAQGKSASSIIRTGRGSSRIFIEEFAPSY